MVLLCHCKPQLAYDRVVDEDRCGDTTDPGERFIHTLRKELGDMRCREHRRRSSRDPWQEGEACHEDQCDRDQGNDPVCRLVQLDILFIACIKGGQDRREGYPDEVISAAAMIAPSGVTKA